MIILKIKKMQKVKENIESVCFHLIPPRRQGLSHTSVTTVATSTGKILTSSYQFC